MKFIKQFSLYTLVGFFGAAVNFFLLPVLSFHLKRSDYGLISIFNSYVSILLPFVGLMAYSILNIEYFKIKEKKKFADKFSSVQFVPVVPFLLLAVICWFGFAGVSGLLELKNTSNL